MLADIFECKAGSFPSTYLGLSLCHGTPTKSLWYLVIERMEKKLSLWKANYLSLGGIITLIKAALANLPIYLMSLSKCPREIINQIEKLQWNFLWNGKEKNKFHLIKWLQVSKPKKESGLGIRPLKEMDLALLGKWLWRIDESQSLWKQVIFYKYGVCRGGWLIRAPLPRFSALWRGILTAKKMLFRQVRFRVGKGDNIYFWMYLGWGIFR